MIVNYSGSGGVTATNVLAFHSIGGTFGQTNVNAMTDEWLNLWASIGSVNWSVDAGIEMQSLASDPHPALFGHGDVTNGNLSSANSPANVAMCVSYHTAAGGRSGRGRTYLPGMIDSNVTDDSRFEDAFIADVIDAYSTFTVAISVVGWILAVYSRTLNEVNAVSGLSIDGVVDTQRRRVERLSG